MSFNLVRLTICAGIAFLAAACSTTPAPVGLAASAQAIEGDLPAPTAADFAQPVRPFYLGPGDKIRVDVFGVAELAREAQVDSAGQVAFPLIGSVEAAGRTPSQLASDIQGRLQGRYVKNPQVTVNVVESSNQTLTVEGQVARPGMYPVTGRMTLQRAVAAAGGVSEFAKLNDVIIKRDVGSQTYVGIYNLGAIRRGNYPDPEVFPTDIVVVGDSKERRLFRDLLQVVPLLTTPIILLTRN